MKTKNPICIEYECLTLIQNKILLKYRQYFTCLKASSGRTFTKIGYFYTKQV